MNLITKPTVDRVDLASIFALVALVLFTVGGAIALVRTLDNPVHELVASPAKGA